MSLNKRGSPVKINIVKESSFQMSVDVLAQSFLKDWPQKQITMDQIHDVCLKSIGIINYSSEDLSVLIGRLESIGFSVTK